MTEEALTGIVTKLQSVLYLEARKLPKYKSHASVVDCILPAIEEALERAYDLGRLDGRTDVIAEYQIEE